MSLDLRTASASVVVSDLFDDAAKLLAAVDEQFGTYLGTSRGTAWVSRFTGGDVDSADVPGAVNDVLRVREQIRRTTDDWFAAEDGDDETTDQTSLIQGWAAKTVSDLFLRRGFPDHCVTAAGRIVASGFPADGLRWRVGVADPSTVGALLGYVDGTGAFGESSFGTAGRRWSVATCAVSERWRPQVIDPPRGTSANKSSSVTVIGRHGGLTAGYASAVVAAGGRAEAVQALHRLGFATVVVTGDGSTWDPFGYLHPLLS